jgi:hypothetical protein
MIWKEICIPSKDFVEAADLERDDLRETVNLPLSHVFYHYFVWAL